MQRDRSPRGDRVELRRWCWQLPEETLWSPDRRAPTALGDRRSEARGLSAGMGHPQGTAAPGRSVPLVHNADPRTAGHSGR